jgi:hypothetical protein
MTDARRRCEGEGEGVWKKIKGEGRRCGRRLKEMGEKIKGED